MIQNVLCMLAWHFSSYMFKTLFSIYCYSFQNGLLISKDTDAKLVTYVICTHATFSAKTYFALRISREVYLNSFPS
jgi:hypothetical protein